MQNLKSSAEKVLEVILELNLEESPIFCHAFSNAGGMVYQHISQLCQTGKYAAVNIIGCIFDSLPCPLNYLVGANAVVNSFEANIVVRYTVYFMFLALWPLKELWAKVWSGPSERSLYWDYMYNERVKWPSLYLYSKVDEIVDSQHIENVISNRKKLGADIAVLCWDDSAHVQHLRKHREAYIRRCLEFLDDCLLKSSSQDST